MKTPLTFLVKRSPVFLFRSFRPVTPHRAAGWRIDPPVSLPTPKGAIRAAMHAAAPPLEAAQGGDTLVGRQGADGSNR